MKKRVKILESIAGLGDPQPAQLERKYARIRQDLTERAIRNNREPSPTDIEAAVNAEKRKDALWVKTGFNKDWSFKPGDEPLIDAALAEKWEEAGICIPAPTPTDKSGSGEKKAA